LKAADSSIKKPWPVSDFGPHVTSLGIQVVRRSLAMCICCWLMPDGLARAQGYPERSVRVIVGSAAGGNADILARIVSQRLGQKLEQQFISVKALVASARARLRELSFASAGTGSPGHLAGVLFNSASRVTMVHVPYKATQQAMTDLSKLHENLVDVVQAPEVRERFAALGANPVTHTPAAFGSLIVEEIAKWAKVVREAGVRID
jgi:tripartite-type tricarboxylate transporter receptor subunit TctC